LGRSLVGEHEFRSESAHQSSDPIPHPSEAGILQLRRVFQLPIPEFQCFQVGRTARIVETAHRDPDLGPIHELGRELLGGMVGEREAHLREHRPRPRVGHGGRSGPGGDGTPSGGRVGVENRLRHQGPTGILYADEQDQLFLHQQQSQQQQQQQLPQRPAQQLDGAQRGTWSVGSGMVTSTTSIGEVVIRRRYVRT
jgi:hypothetical protein